MYYYFKEFFMTMPCLHFRKNGENELFVKSTKNHYCNFIKQNVKKSVKEQSKNLSKKYVKKSDKKPFKSMSINIFFKSVQKSNKKFSKKKCQKIFQKTFISKILHPYSRHYIMSFENIHDFGSLPVKIHT